MSTHFQPLGAAGDPVSSHVAVATRPFVPGEEIGTPAPGTTSSDEGKPAAAKVKKPLFSIGKTIKPDVVMAFSRQLSSFLEAGIPVLDALEIVAQQTGSPPMRVVITDIRDSIHRGTSFASAVDAHPEVFPAFYRAMLESAEYTGNLDTVLTQLSEYLERDIAAKRQVKSALTYPIVVLVIAFIALIVMSVFVLPKFTGLYATPRRTAAPADPDVDRVHQLHDCAIGCSCSARWP